MHASSSTSPEPSAAHLFKVGDRARIVKSLSWLHDRVIGKAGTVTAVEDLEPEWVWIELDTPELSRDGAITVKGLWVLFDELEAVQ